MKGVRSPELTLLLIACTGELSSEKTAQVLLFLQQHSPLWDRLIKLADQHRLTPFLYRTLREIPTVPNSFVLALRQECLAIAKDNLLKLHEYKRVAAVLSGYNIEHISFKGIYLTEHSYPESNLRPIGDMDILVDEKDVYKVARIVAPEGYQVEDKYHPYLRHTEQVMLDDLHQISLFKLLNVTSRFDIDLHWRINILWREIGYLQLSDVLSSDGHLIENQVVLLVLHHGINNLWERIGYVNDLYFLLSSANVDWPWLLKKLNQYKLEISFFVGLHWCQQLWEFPVPAAVQTLMPIYRLRLLAHSHEKKWDDQSLNLFRSKIVDFVNAQTSLKDKLTIYAAYSHSFIFRSSLIKIRHHQLYIPKKWGFTTVLIRALLALWRRR